MPSRPHALIVRAPGTNCDVETAYAFELAGASAETIHINELLEFPNRLAAAQIFCIPGGFSYGDDLGAGRLMAKRLRDALGPALLHFRDEGNCVLGICNGFQVLLQTGLLIAENYGATAVATLALNDSGVYRDCWVDLQVTGQQSVFLEGLDRLYLPVAHAEGKFVVDSQTTLASIQAKGQIALTYADPSGVNGPVEFPTNPNGSMGNVAGICDASGRVLGLMPHPERFVHRTQHPRWTREELPEAGDGLRLFQNVVNYLVSDASGVKAC